MSFCHFPWATCLKHRFLSGVKTALRIAYQLIWNCARFLSQDCWPFLMMKPFSNLSKAFSMEFHLMPQVFLVLDYPCEELWVRLPACWACGSTEMQNSDLMKWNSRCMTNSVRLFGRNLGNVLIRTSWYSFYSLFHRQHPTPSMRCSRKAKNVLKISCMGVGGMSNVEFDHFIVFCVIIKTWVYTPKY